MENTTAAMSSISRQNPESSSTDAPRKTSRLFTFLHFLIIVSLIAAVSWLWVAQQNAKQTLTSIKKQSTTTSTELQQQQQTMQAQLNHLSQQSQQQQVQFNQLNTQLSQLAQREPGDEKAWKISEIIYLVRVANLQLTVQHSLPTALALLNQADMLLAALDDAALDDFHQAVSKAISELQAIPPVDSIAISTQLSALRDQVPNLSILVAPKPDTSVLQLTQHQQQKKWWQRAWDNIKASMQQLVVVRHQQELPALMSPDQQIYLQENLQLLLMQAQWALMNQKPDLYSSSLKQANAWVNKYYVQNSATTQDFLKQLQGLQSINIAPSLPDLSHILALASQE
jgi:uroporphyrin-III C-methyltransferase